MVGTDSVFGRDGSYVSSIRDDHTLSAAWLLWAMQKKMYWNLKIATIDLCAESRSHARSAIAGVADQHNLVESPLEGSTTGILS